MNAYIDGMTLQEKERTVRDLVYATGSRVMSGVRYLPLHWYEAGEIAPPTELIDEHGRVVDDEGLPVIDTEDEVVAVTTSTAGGKKRTKMDTSMPSQAAILSDASTDSEIGPGTYRKRTKPKVAVPPPPAPPSVVSEEQVKNSPIFSSMTISLLQISSCYRSRKSLTLRTQRKGHRPRDSVVAETIKTAPMNRMNVTSRKRDLRQVLSSSWIQTKAALKASSPWTFPTRRCPSPEQ